MKYIIPFLLILITNLCFADETVLCRGAYWAYKYSFDKNKCVSEMKVIKDFPEHKVGHKSEPNNITLLECWTSVAKIQMDGAQCCIESADDFRISCSYKKINY